MTTATVPAIAWQLRADSVTGGKIYTIAVFGNVLVVGWGRESTGTTAYKVTVHPTHDRAVAAAQAATSEKENGGYDLKIAPRLLIVPATRPADLVEARTSQRSAAFVREKIFHILAPVVEYGVPL